MATMANFDASKAAAAAEDMRNAAGDASAPMNPIYANLPTMESKLGPSQKERPEVKELQKKAWNLNSYCSKPNGKFTEESKHKAHKISSKVTAFCNDAEYSDPKDWAERAVLFEKMIDDETARIKQEEEDTEKLHKEHPEVAVWRDGKYVAERKAEVQSQTAKAGRKAEKADAGRELSTSTREADMDALDEVDSLDAARLRVEQAQGGPVDLSGLDLCDDDVEAIFEMVPRACASLDLRSNRLADAGLQQLVPLLLPRTDLKALQLGGNVFGELGTAVLGGLRMMRKDLIVDA